MENISKPNEPFSPNLVGIIIILATSAGLFNSIQKLSLGYIFHEPQFWCSQGHTNISLKERTSNDAVPIDQCQQHNNASTIPCDHWDYDRSEYPETVVSQFNLVCDERYWTINQFISLVM